MYARQHRLEESKGYDIALPAALRDIAESRQAKAKAAEKSLRVLHGQLLREHQRRKSLSGSLIDLIETERKRIAMELHDHIGQVLTTLKMDLEWVSSHANQFDPDCRERIESARMAAVETMKGIKDIAHGLRPSLLDDLGLVSSLKNLIVDIKRSTNVEVHFFSRDVPKSLDQEKATSLYRVVQEILCNAIKHARPDNIYINLVGRLEDGILSLSVEDDGIGFKLDRVRNDQRDNRPMGLLFLEERVVQINGALHMESHPGEGTYFVIDIPL